MDTSYNNMNPKRRHHAVRGRHGRSMALAPREQRRLLQLCIAAVLFLVVFFGRGVFPEKLDAVRQELLQLIRTDTDFTAAFANLGRAIDRGEPVAKTLEGLWVDVFAGGRVGTGTVPTWEDTPLYDEELAFFASEPDAEDILAHRFGIKLPAATTPTDGEAEAPRAAEPEPVYTGPPFPENATMDRLPLGLEQTETPVMAVVSSAYGWREHPIEGGEKFHAGADLAANYGEPIGAFADGVVDYIGESPAYGQYLQIRHAGGVTSFYAHCSRLCVQQGQTVTMGERVAEVGDTGETTGAHLHFELKLNGELLNPLYYIETE